VDDHSVWALPLDDCSVQLEWAAADSVPAESVRDDYWAAPRADDLSAPVALPDDYWVAQPVDDRSVLAAPPDDCSVRLEWVPDGSIQDDCWAAPQADDQFALVAPPDDCSVRPEWAAADSVPEESVQDDCLAAQWPDDLFALAALPDDYWVVADLDDSAPPDYSADSLQADYWVAPPVAARDDCWARVDLNDYSWPVDCSERGGSVARDLRRDARLRLLDSLGD